MEHFAHVSVSNRTTFMHTPKPETREASKQRDAWMKLKLNCGFSLSGITADSVEILSKMSKAEILRGFVTERLAAASQEILAAVDKIVAGYEEEASGFRQEIDRQRRQLEVLLLPQVTVDEAGWSKDLNPATPKSWLIEIEAC